MSVTINVLVTQECGWWIAVGLEHFTVARGKTPIEAIRDLEVRFEGQEIFDQSHNQTPFSLVPRAPEEYWKLFETAPLRLVWQSETHPPYEGELRMTE